MDSNDDIQLLAEGKFLRLLRKGRWEYAERVNASAAVIIIALTPDDKLLFVEQFRVPMNANCIEMPAGLVGDLDARDTMESAARRELLEETGWQAEHVEVLVAGPSSAGMSNEMIAFARATNLKRVHAGGGDASENITVHEIPRSEVPRWLAQKMTEGYSLDPKLWGGLWLLDRNPDGSPA